MFTLYRIAFGPARKPYRLGLLFIHKNNDFGATSVAEQCCAAPISSDQTPVSLLHGSNVQR